MIDFTPELENAIAMHRLGRIDEAETVYHSFTATQPDLAEPWHLLGVIELQKGNPEKAEPFFREALQRDRTHVKCLSNLGGALYQMGRLQEAERSLRSTLRLAPEHIDALYNLGNVQMALSQPEDAMASYAKVLEIDPKHVKTLINVTVLHRQNHSSLEAKAFIEKALSLEPDNFLCLLNLAAILERLNNLTGARKTIVKALTQHPDHKEANLILAILDLRDENLQAALTRLEIVRGNIDDDQASASVYFTLAHVLDELNRPVEAFEAYTKANSETLEKALSNGASPQIYEGRLDEAHKRLDEEALIPGKGAYLPEDPRTPVFFVGFPRSGTTLFEQMLRSHPDIITTNETSPLLHALCDTDLCKSVNTLGEQEQAILRERFWHKAAEIAGEPNGRLLVDTAPLNIRLLDVVERIFPNAKVVMIVRDPRDVCLSCFMQNFASTNSLSNFSSLESTVRVYDKLMSLWNKQENQLTLRRYVFKYEDLIIDMNEKVRDVLDFIGLEWTDEILAYRDRSQEGHVITPSYRQVGEVLHNRAIGRWRKYEKHIAPFMDTLTPYIKAFGYDDCDFDKRR